MLLWVVARLISGALWFFSILLFAGAFRSGFNFIGIFLVAPAGLFLNIVLHEVGHAGAARAVGWHVIVFVVGPYGFQALNRDYAWVPRAKRKHASGWVFAIPGTRDLATKPREILYIVGGPILSLVCSIAFFAAASALPDPNGLESISPAMLCAGLGVQSLAMFAGTILPYKHASTTSDGHKLLEVLRRQPAHDSHRFLLWLAYLLQSSVRLRDVPGWLVECVGSNSNSGDGIDRYVDSIRVGQALDVDVPDIPVARRLLEGFRSDYGTSHWLVACEAFLAAAHEHDVDRAKILLSELESPSDVPQLTLAAEAAVAMLEGRTDVAKQKCAEMTSIVRQEKDFPDLTYRDLERKILALEAG